MANATTIVPAGAGELLALEGETTVMLFSSCGGPTPMLACVPCGVRLANIGQVEMHLETPGAHRIAGHCARHGWEAMG